MRNNDITCELGAAFINATSIELLNNNSNATTISSDTINGDA